VKAGKSFDSRDFPAFVFLEEGQRAPSRAPGSDLGGQGLTTYDMVDIL